MPIFRRLEEENGEAEPQFHGRQYFWPVISFCPNRYHVPDN
jgi:hypothetical protein